MGRELRRKQAKKDGKSLQKVEINEKNQIKSLIIITIVLVIIIGVIYLLSAIFVTGEIDWFSKKTETPITENVKNTILAKETFNQKEDEYYVYFYDYSDEDTRISSIINEKLASKTVYKVNTNSALNANYVSETSNKKAKKLSELKVKESTLIKFSKNKIVSYYEGNEIMEKLQENK